MITEEVIIQNKLGMHARPAALFVQTASKFKADITVSKNGVQVNGKSVMGMMMLAAECGSKLKITAKGDDEKNAIATLRKIFENKFDEE
jgi:phosphotransferase system HPr (HPr) family protein